MHSIAETIRQGGRPLTDAVVRGPCFRIGRPEFVFEAAQGGDAVCAHVCREHRLRVESRVRTAGSAFVISHRLKNTGAEKSLPIDVLEPLSMVFDIPPEDWRHLYANGGTTEAFYPPLAYRMHEMSQCHHGMEIKSHPKGRSSNLHLPLLISARSTAPDAAGLFCGMEWSATWYLRFEEAGDGRSRLCAGIDVRGLRLEAGESLEFPPVHLGFFSGGPDGGTNALRRYLYEYVCPAYQGKPVIPRVSYDIYFGIENRVNAALIKRQADRAAELGVEVFTGADGAWPRGGFPGGVGNWHEADPQRYPEGLEPLADYVRALGMQFGHWFDIERALEGSWFLEQHPEWFVPSGSDGGKKAYHLDLSIPGAQDAAIEIIAGWIERLDARWCRYDYNIEPMPFWEQRDPTLKIQFAYLRGLYRVLDELMARYPAWMVESCASGGRRIDIGMLKRAHTCWFSDQSIRPHLCRYMQARANRFLPGHLLNSSVAVRLGNGDAGFDDTAVLSRMLGKLAFDGDIASWSRELTLRMKRWVEEFKAIRHLMVQDFFQLLPLPTTADDWDAVEFVSYDGDEAALFVFAGAGGGRKAVRLKGLDAEAGHVVTRSPDGAPETVAGAVLMEAGLAVELGSQQGGLWRIHRDPQATRQTESTASGRDAR